MKSLDFVVIGASKSGTTTLFRHLRQHPSIFVPEGKDAPFFSRERLDEAHWNRFASEFFSRAKPEQRWGTVTPRYMEDLRVAASMARLMPETRLVAILRNPIDRTFSHYRQQIRRDKEARDFQGALDEELARTPMGKALTPEVYRTLCHFHPARSHYAFVLRHYLQHFQEKQLLVLFTEELEEKPQAILDRLMAHLSLAEGFAPPTLGQRYHVGGTRQRFPWLIPVVRRLAPVRWLWHGLTRSRRRALWAWFFTQVNVVPESAPALQTALRTRLRSFYREDVAALEDLLGRKVPWPEFH